MKLVLAVAVAAMTLLAAPNAKADATQDLEAQAQKAYDGRDYTNAGRASALQAAVFYGQLAQKATDPLKKAEYSTRQAGACFFLGDSAQDNNEKITQFGNGMALADGAVRAFGLNDLNNVSDADVQNLLKRPKEQLNVLAEALYVRGINQGQWGQANGVMQSLDKWPELKATMELIVKIGFKQLHEYGAYRTLGRGLFKIPELLGGDQAKAAKYLQVSVQGSLAPGQVYSVNGYNNLFYAELLHDQGQPDQAKKILQDYLKADPNTVLPGYAAESREAQRQAVEMLKSW